MGTKLDRPPTAADGDGQGLAPIDYAGLLRVAETLSAELDLDRLLVTLMRLCIEVASADRAALVLDVEGLIVRARVDARGEPTLEDTPLDLVGSSLPARLIERAHRLGEVVQVDDASRAAGLGGESPASSRRARSILAVPIGRAGRRLGVLVFEGDRAHAFHERQVEAFRLLSGEIAVSLENSLLFEERRRAESALRLLSDASAALSTSLDVEACLSSVGRVIVPSLADGCGIDLLEGGGLRPVVLMHANPEKQALLEALHRDYPARLEGRAAVADVLRSNEPLLLPHVSDEQMRAWAQDEEHLRRLEPLRPLSLMAVPFSARGRPLGVATLVRTTTTRRYSASDLSLAEELARRVAMAVDNALLHRDLADAMRQRVERDRYLDMTFRQLPGVVWMTDASLRVTYVTGGEAVGPRPRVGGDVREFLDGHEPDGTVEGRHRAALSGERQSFQCAWHGRWYALLVEPFRDERGAVAGCVGGCWDVTDLKQTIQKLELAVARWEATLNATAEGILVVDTEGRVTAFNERFLSLWQLSSPGEGPISHFELLTPMLDQLEDPEGFTERLRQLYERPEEASFDLVRFKDGRVFERHAMPQRVGEQIVGRVWSVRNVTERERLLRRATFLADVTRLLASLDVEQALDSVARMAVPYMGESCAIDVLGDGVPRRHLVVWRDAARPIEPAFDGSTLAGEPSIRAVGARDCMSVPLLVKGAVIGAMSFVAPPHRPYTQQDLELAEELARRAALSLENARLFRGAQEALRARDEFLSVAAHEIRGPITSMHLAVQGVLQSKLPVSAMPKVLEIIEREDRRLAGFVDELLEIGRIQGSSLRFTFEQVDLCRVVREAASRLGPELRRSGSQLILDCGEGSVVGWWDRSRLVQVMVNLLSNAIKFGLGKPIEIAVSASEGRATVSVRDRGIGIPREMLARIFQPFERAVSARHYGGLGLGLHIARTIVEGLGGALRVDSQPNVGSTFTVDLPQRSSSR